MTYLLQVLDLVVNGPIKAHIRTMRARRIYDYMQTFRQDFNAELRKPFEDRIMPKWKPPKPELSQCIQDLLGLVATNGSFTTDRFKGIVKKSFVETGTAPDQDGNFQKYAEIDTKGSFHHPPTGTVLKSDFPAAAVDLAHLDDIIAEILDEDDDEDS